MITIMLYTYLPLLSEFLSLSIDGFKVFFGMVPDSWYMVNRKLSHAYVWR